MSGRGALAALLLCLATSAVSARAAVSSTTLTVCDDVQDPPSLNPYLIFSEKTLTLLQQMLEGLVRFDAQGRVEPALAERWRRVDERRIRFYLRRGVVFHNGEPFDARSVKFSLEKYVAPETRYAGYGFVETIASVAVVDDYTVDVVTNRPDGLLLNRLAAWAHIVPRRYYQDVGAQGFAERPVGTGPFQFEEWKKGREVSFSANPRYWMRGYPKVQRLVFKFLPAEKQLGMLKDGEIDLTTELPGTLTIQAAREDDIKVSKKPSFYAVTGSFNSNHGPLKSLLVRRALNYGINKQELIRYDQLGNGSELATVTMPGEEGHNDALAPYPYDLRKARALLKEAGYPNGFTLKVIAKAQGIRAAQILEKQFEKIHVKLELHLIPDAEIIDALRRETWDMIVAGCPDPMATSYFIQSVFLYSKSPYSLVSDAAYDAHLNEMVATIDDAKRDLSGRELDRYIHDQALMLFLYQRIKTYGVRKDVVFAPSVTGMSYFFSAEKSSATTPR